jgi:catechol 2,3-dioxygenase-like lactoylglutathione lyase family enzyme
VTGAPGRPELAALAIADPPERWRALGFAVAGSWLRLGSVRVELGRSGEGIVAWELRGSESEIDGLLGLGLGLGPAPEPSPGADASHPNGAVGIDHVVIATPDFDRTATALEDAGLGFRRVRDAGGFRQGFRRLGPAIMEVVEARGGDRPAGDARQPGDPAATDAQPARFWGLVVVVEDLEALAERLDEQLGAIKPAVQPGRRIATLRESAGLTTKLAFMDPEPGRSSSNTG